MFRSVFILFIFLSQTSFSQMVKEVIPIDTTSIIYNVIFSGNSSNDYFFKQTGYFANNRDVIAVEKNFTSNGIQNGLYKAFYPSERLRVLTVYANGKINGEYTLYDKKGIILVKGVYKNGIKHGYWAYKSIKTYGRYKKGLKNGKWIKRDKNNKKLKAYYKKGVFIRGVKFENESTQPNVIKDNGDTLTGKKVELTNSTKINFQHQQAINVIKKNTTIKKAVTEYFATTFLEIRQFKKNYKKDVFQFIISPSIIPLSINTFISDSKKGKIIVSKIDSILKIEGDLLEQKINKSIGTENENLYNQSTNKSSNLTLYFWPINEQLLRVDIVKYNSPTKKENFITKYNTTPANKKFSILFYYNNKNILQGAEYQKNQ